MNESPSLRRAKRSRSIAWVVLALLASPASAQPTPAPVAQIFGTALECQDVGAHEPNACALGLLRYARSKAAAAFVARNGLEATRSDLERLMDYNRAFERHDRSQRTRKLAELETRLASDTLVPSERARLEAFRTLLLRLAQYDSDVDAGIEARTPLDEQALRGWIETAKLNAALYAKYGGAIGVAAHGPYAHGAMRALIAEHVERSDIRILDPVVAERFFAALDAPPRMAHIGAEPDFTPFWERPIPPSYLPH